MEEKKQSFKGYIAGIVSGVACVICVAVLLNLFAPGIFKVNIGSGATPPDSVSSDGISPTDVEKKLDKIFDILDSHYVGEYEKVELLETMYQGLVYGVGDPYTTYMTKEVFEEYIQDTDGSFAGIGVVVSVDKTDNRIVVISPYEGCPGANAGILPKDKIIKINGYEVFGDGLDEAIKMIKGVRGTSVTVTILRESTGETLNLDIVRDNIEVQTVSHEMIDGDIGYIRITQFTKVTDTQFFEALEDLKSKNMKGLIIDLRNNPGGLLDVVCNITDALIPQGTITYTEDKSGERKYHKSDKNYLNLPLLILVNENSASASEVLSGAVKDTGVGELIGTQTYGKGLVQAIYTLPDGSAVKVTIAKYYTPNGICIQDIGIEPHYKVEMDSSLTATISSLSLDEDVQLKSAVSVMTGKIINNQ